MKKYVVVGTGGRGTYSYIMPLARDFQDCVKICGVYDINYKRARAGASKAAYPVEVFDDFDKMLETVKPDGVIVTTKDATHSDYIVKALDFGCDVVSEKPLTTDEVKMKAIYEAEKRSGKRVQVTFNLRFTPAFMRVKELLNRGVIGTPLSVHYEWMLDTSHGADYFRRWHRERKNSGSLLIHKSTHHFDILNWFLDDEPEKINAFGTRRFYGDNRREHGERCLTCKYKDKCEYYFDIAESDMTKEFYLDCEDVDGYYRDGCIFSDEIDIEDSVSLNIKYKKGVVASYSLTAHSPYEAMRICINGTDGRLEFATGYATGMFAGAIEPKIVIFDRLGERIEIGFKGTTEAMRNLPRFGRNTGGGHGGSDSLMLDMIFRGEDPDPMDLLAGSRAGAMSIGIGIAANKSMAEDRAVTIKELYDFYD